MLDLRGLLKALENKIQPLRRTLKYTERCWEGEGATGGVC